MSISSVFLFSIPPLWRRLNREGMGLWQHKCPAFQNCSFLFEVSWLGRRAVIGTSWASFVKLIANVQKWLVDRSLMGIQEVNKGTAIARLIFPPGSLESSFQKVRPLRVSGGGRETGRALLFEFWEKRILWLLWNTGLFLRMRCRINRLLGDFFFVLL